MRFWGYVVTIAMGFILGLGLAGVFGTSVGLALVKGASEFVHSDQLKIQDYWQNSDIEQSDFDQYINNTNCYATERNFYACVNSLFSVLQKTSLKLSTDGKISNISSANEYLDQYSEKQLIQPFMDQNLFKKKELFNFELLWNQIFEFLPQFDKKYALALGINGFLSVRFDPHTYILPTDYFNEVTSKSERTPLFVGLSLERELGLVKIQKVYKDSDADVSGLKQNDIVLSINGQKTADVTLSDISNLLKDETQKSYIFYIQRGSEKLIKKVNRSFRTLNQVYASEVEGLRKTGLIQIGKFAKGTCESVRLHIQKFNAQRVQQLILDLRDNPGGHLSEAACLAGLFVGPQKVVYSVDYFDESEKKEIALTSEDQIFYGPMIVLINNASASAAEVIAGVFKEYHRAFLVGERTFGKGTFQEYDLWNKKSKVSFFETKGFYRLPSRVTPQLIGIQPDYKLSSEAQKHGEDINYLFPIVPGKFIKNSATDDSEKYLDQTCQPYQFESYSSDVYIEKGLQLLSCPQVVKKLTQQFSEISIQRSAQR